MVPGRAARAQVPMAAPDSDVKADLPSRWPGGLSTAGTGTRPWRARARHAPILRAADLGGAAMARPGRGSRPGRCSEAAREEDTPPRSPRGQALPGARPVLGPGTVTRNRAVANSAEAGTEGGSRKEESERKEALAGTK